MIGAKAISLTVRPSQVSMLCFEVGGILGDSFAELGAKVSAFDFSHLFAAIRDTPTSASDAGRLELDSRRIDSLTILTPDKHRFALAALRSEPVKTALQRAIDARANAFYTRFENAPIFIENMKAQAVDKQARLIRLSQHILNQANLLNDLYTADGKLGVLRTTHTDATARTTTTDENNNSKGTTTETQNSDTVDAGGYRVPFLENLARNERAQIDLNDEQLAHTLKTPNTNRLSELFKNDLAVMDRDVNQLQIAYANTILLSPINGVVTGVYKNPGDPVSPGEPVFRVENNDEVFLVAAIVCPGRVTPGSVLQVETTLFDSGLRLPPLTAEVVAARGMGEANRWEVIAKRSNLDSAGKTIFPLGYHFDDSTKVIVFDAGEI